MSRLFIIAAFLISEALSSQTNPKYTYAGPEYETWVLADKENIELVLLGSPNNLFKKTANIGDTTVLVLKSDTSLKRKLTFRSAGTCDFDQLVFSNNKAAEMYLSDIINQNSHGWQKVNETRFLSKRKYHLELTLDNNKVTYMLHNLTDHEYELLTKKKQLH